MQEGMDKSTGFWVGCCFMCSFPQIMSTIHLRAFPLNCEIYFSNWKNSDSMPPCKFSVGQNDDIALYTIIKRPHQTMQVSCNVMITVLSSYQLKNMTN